MKPSRNKNVTISASLKATRLRRQKQVCKQYQLKLDESHFNHETREKVPLLFLEAKWLYNHQLTKGVFSTDYKNRTVQVKAGDHYEERSIRVLSSQMRQELLDRTRDNVRGLGALKRNGHRVGALKFKRQVKCIPLKQYGTTYRLDQARNRISIQGVKQKLRVRGLGQIPAEAEFANALLLRKPDGIYLNVTTYQSKPEPKTLRARVGTDLGIKEQLVLSNGIQLQFQVPMTERIRRLHRELSKRKRYSKNWRKTRNKLDRAYDECTRQKRDTRNKIVSKLTRTYGTISYQDDNVAGWQRMWGRRIQATAIGGLTSALRKKAQTPIEIERFYPSTKRCSRCGAINKIALDERVYHCATCGLVIDRNLNAAANIKSKKVPVECRESTPVDTKTTAELLQYFNSIPGVRASLVEEAGSPQVMSNREEAHDFSHG